MWLRCLNTIGDQTVNEFVELTFTATASDDDSLTFLLDGTFPSGAAITSAGVFTWTPTESQDGDHTITVQVTDGSLTDSETLTVTVNEVNVAPVLNAIGDKGTSELVELTFTATASDTDVVDNLVNTLTFSFDGTVPPGAAITSAGVFTWTPTELQVGSHDITVQVTDGSLTDSETLTVTVKDTTAPRRITLSADAFITTWRTDSANQTITIPVGGSTAKYSIDWGDNSPAETDITGDSTHTYREADSYTVSISGGLERFHLDGQQPNAGRLASIEQWGDTRWTTMDTAFDGATNMVYRATDTPDLSGVTDMHRMFGDATAFNGDLSSWDVSKVTDMSNMFIFAYDFNGNLSSWNVSSVTNMNEMFAVATSFNQPLNDWDVSSVTYMSGMFYYASVFNHPLNDWDVSRVTNMDDMFYFATAFSQNLGNWYVTLDPDTIADTGIPGVVGTISAQNQPLKNHSPTYVIVDGLDKNHFEIVPGNQLNMISGVSGKAEYSVNVTASGGSVFESGNNWRLLEIKVTGQTTDTTPPVIKLEGSSLVTITVDDTYTEQGAVCDDDVDADKPATVGGDTVDTSTVGQYTVTYDCTDSSNNEATQVSRTVNVQSAPDTDAPVIIITGSANIQLTVDETYTEQGAVCDDDVDADKPATVGGDTVDTSTVGQYTVTYDCTDSSNNEATQVSRTVNVQSAPDTDAPVIIITGSANIQLTVDDTYTEQGAVCDDDVDADKPATVGGDTVDTSTVGQYTVTYDCTDSSNNEATQVSRTVNVQSAPDTDAPVIIITGLTNIQLTVDDTYTEQGGSL